MPPRSTSAKSIDEITRDQDVMDELRRRYDKLTNSQKRIAEYIVEHSHSIAFMTVDQMAAELDVNPSTVVRFAYRLGLNGFPHLQERMRELLRGQLSRAEQSGDRTLDTSHLDGTPFGASFNQDIANLDRTIAGIRPADLQAAVDAIVGARRVYAVAGASSYAIAHYLGLILERLMGNAVLLGADNGLSASRLGDMSEEDCMVAFTFPPYAASTNRAVLWARENNVKVIGVTDTPISAVGQVSDTVLLAGCAGSGMQNSLVAAFVVVNALLNGVAVALGSKAVERYGRIDRLMNKWDVFLLKDDGNG